MPKMKTNSSAKKRFRKTASGQYKHRAANRNHILTKKAPKRKRQLRAPSLLPKASIAAIRKMLGKFSK